MAELIGVFVGARNTLLRRGPESACKLALKAAAKVRYTQGGTPYTDTLSAGTWATDQGSVDHVDLTANSYVLYSVPAAGGAGTLKLVPLSGYATLAAASDIIPLFVVTPARDQVYQASAFAVAYPATGTPSAAAPANAGKLGVVYPDGATIQITADGEISAVATSTVTVVSTPAAEKTYYLGVFGSYAADPTNWTLPSFNDASWSASTDDTHDQTVFGSGASIAGTTWIADLHTNAQVTPGTIAGSAEWLMRRTFTLPPGVPISGSLQIVVDAEVLSATINGTAISGATASGYGAVTTVTVPATALLGGAANVLALKIRNGSATGMTDMGDSALRYKLVMTTASSKVAVAHNGAVVDTQPIVDFEDPAFVVTDDAANNRVQVSLAPFGASGPGHGAGAVPDPGASAGSTHFLREDGGWAVPPGITPTGATDGELLIGKTSDHSLNLATLTAGSGITITNGAGSIVVAATGGGGGFSLPSASAQLTGDVTMVNANQFYDGPTISLATGTWLIIASLSFKWAAQAYYTLKIWDGTTVGAGIGSTNANSDYGMTLGCLVTVTAGPTTWKVSVAATSGNNKIAATPVSNTTGLTNKGSTISAIQVA